MAYEIIGFEIEAGVAIITLNRPDKLNSFNQTMAYEVQSALDYCMDDSAVRCVVITGAGRAFCAGQDGDPRQHQGVWAGVEHRTGVGGSEFRQDGRRKHRRRRQLFQFYVADQLPR